MNFSVFPKMKLRNLSLSEKIENGTWMMAFTENGVSKTLAMYSLSELEQQELTATYRGHKLSDIMDSGKDILGAELLREGEPQYQAVKECLPKLQTGAFAFLSGALSWSGRWKRIRSVVWQQKEHHGPMAEAISCFFEEIPPVSWEAEPCRLSAELL